MSQKKHIIDFRIRSSWHGISRLYNRSANAHDSTSSMGFALLNIEKVGTPSTQLGPKMGMESRSLSRILKSMLDSGLIFKKGDKSDKRKTHIFLSDKGLSLRKIAAHQVKSFNECVFNKVSRKELKAFYKVMDAVDESIEELQNER
tara:strand:- start:3892 stop:4329 length:438 start_codon:yes stop_codon:yes gene_type:complete